MTREDWRRTLLATEIVFASDVVGAGTDWPVTTGLSDQETVAALRAIQKKIGRALYRAGPTADKRPRRAAVFPFHCSLVCVVCRC
jgi:hypothetical protein